MTNLLSWKQLPLNDFEFQGHMAVVQYEIAVTKTVLDIFDVFHTGIFEMISANHFFPEYPLACLAIA